LPVDISNCIVEGLVDTGASMLVLAAAIVRELGMMHLVTGNESYKTASGVITRALGRVDEVQVKIGGIQCAMTFMVVDTDGYDVLLGLDFLMKIGAVVDVERGLIQVWHGPGTNVEVLPLTVVNLLHKVSWVQWYEKRRPLGRTHMLIKKVTGCLIKIERLSTKGVPRLPQILMMKVTMVNIMTRNLID